MIRGDAFDEKTRGTLVVGDVGSNLIHRKRLKLGSKNSGLEYVAERIDQESELVASTDTWFRPAQFANGPDGALYIIDVYREVIEHPASLPPAIKKHLDLDSGRDRGRIWRLAPENFKHRPMPQLDKASTQDLALLLGHANAWHRETAARLLRERQDPETINILEGLARNDVGNSLRRVQAMYVLRSLRPGFTEADEATVLALLRADEPRVRKHGARRAEAVHFARNSQPIAAQLIKLADDEDPQVRFQAAWSIGRLVDESKDPRAIAQLLIRDRNDPWMRLACTASASSPYAAILAGLVREPVFRREPDKRAVILALLQRMDSLSVDPFGGEIVREEPAQMALLLEQLTELPAEDSIFAFVVARARDGVRKEVELRN